MRIRLQDVGYEKRTVAGELPASVLGLGTESDAEHVRDIGPISCRLTVYEAAGQLIVEGEVRTRARFRCSRCDEFFSMEIGEPDIRLAPEIGKNDEFADLTADIRESILLRFPAFPVCREDCPGLCPQCGIRRAEAACDCRRPSDQRWAALDGLQPSGTAEQEQ